MIDGKPALKAILRVNLRIVTALLVLGYGWLCWQGTSPQMWGLGLTAILCGIGGALHLAGAVVQAVRLLLQAGKVRRFAAQGGQTRGDRMARDADLKSRGMIR